MEKVRFVKVTFVPPVDELYFELYKNDTPTGVIYSGTQLINCYSFLEAYERTNNN